MNILRLLHRLLFEVAPWFLMLGGILLFGGDLVSWLFRRRRRSCCGARSNPLSIEVRTSNPIQEPREEP